MRKMIVIAKREYRATVRSKSFVIAIVLMPIFMFGGIAVQRFMEDKIDTGTKKVAVIDYSEKLFDTLTAEAEVYNNTKAVIPETGKQIKPKLALEQARTLTSGFDEQKLELSDRIRNKEIFAFIEIAPDILDNPDPSKSQGISYYSNEPTYNEIERWLGRTINDKVRSVRLASAGIDRTLVDRCMMPVKVDSLNLYTKSQTGDIQQAEQVNDAVVIMVPVILIMLMWVSLMMTTQPLLQGVIEEKMQKISEVLLGSIRPFDLMAGKLLGFVAVALTLVGIYMLGGYFVARQYGYDKVVPTHLLGWFLVFQTLAILMYGSLFLAAGSCCNELREAQNLVMPIWLILVIPMMTLGTIIRHPSSDFSTVLSLFPPATPMVMMLRMAIPPGVPPWQPAVGILGTLLMTLMCVWVAGRIFRVGLLMQGKAPKIGDLIKYAIRG